VIEIDKHISYKLYWIDFSGTQQERIQNLLDAWNLKVLNLGFELASYLKNKTLDIAINNITDYVNFLFDNHQNIDQKNNIPFILIKNVGFLIEPFFQIDPARLLRTYSKNIGVILLWDGKVRDNSVLYWNDDHKYQINFSETRINKIEL
jgi:hypothetical protein